MSLPTDDRILTLLDRSTDPMLLHWAIRKAQHRLTPEQWIQPVLRVFRGHEDLDEAVYDALCKAPWSALRGPLGAVLFDEAVNADSRSLLWIFWAQNEAVVPPPPSDLHLPDAFGLVDHGRAERLWGQAHTEDPFDQLISQLADPECEIGPVVEGILTLESEDARTLWTLLVEPLGDLPDEDVTVGDADFDRLPEPLRTRAAQIIDTLTELDAPSHWRKALELAVAYRQEQAALPLAERVRLVAQRQGDYRGLLKGLPADLKDHPDAEALARASARDLDPPDLLEAFAHLSDDVLAELLLSHWSTRAAFFTYAFGTRLQARPGVLRAIAGSFLAGPDAEIILTALTEMDADWAVDLVLEHTDALLGTLDDEEPLWNAMVGLGDEQFLAVAERLSLPWHPTRAWAWTTLAQIHDRRRPPVRDWLPADESVIDHPLTLRVRCVCGLHTTHPISGLTATLPEVAQEYGLTFDPTWDGITPNERLTCPHCAAIDTYTVARDVVQRLAVVAMNRSAPAPDRVFRDGVSGRPRIFAGELATRPAPTEVRLQERLQEHDTDLLQVAWLAFLFLTHDPRLLASARTACNAHPANAQLHWYRALAAEEAEAMDEAVEAALAGIGAGAQRGPLADLLGLCDEEGGIRALRVVWRHEHRELTGELELSLGGDAIDFLHDIQILSVEPCEGGDPGWIPRWMEGERPLSKAEQKTARLKKKSMRKKKKRKR